MGPHTLRNNLTLQTTGTEERLEDIPLYGLGLGAQKQELWKAPNVEAFMEVFVDCVKCHYHACEEGGVLHCHLTENNLMFEYGPQADGNIRGVLNDWDMALHVDEKVTATHRTGTLPFMAIELLADGNPPPHLYRHDLESFFYILVWAAVNYDFGEGDSRKVDPIIMHEWDASTMKGASEYKWHFITNNSEGTTIRLESVRPKCRILLPLIDSLSDLFCQGHVDRCSRRRPKDWDHNTLGGLITFKTFLKALGHVDEAIMTPVIDGFLEVIEYWPLLAIASSRHHQPRLLHTSSLATDTSASAAMKFENPCRTFWEAPNVEAFMDIFMDCVECHYHAYQKERMPHLNLRESSLMFKYGPNGNVRGVLNDWDTMASDIDNDAKSPLSNATQLTGTIPFMARDLLVDGDPPPPHLYRHDRESFLYILVWAALNHEFGADRPRTCGTIDPLIAHWDVSSVESAQIGKGCFITTYYTTKTKILERVQAKNSFLAPFVDDLWALFCHAHLDHGTRSMKNALEDWDDATLGGRITFENFMKAIRREPR